jgi:hypothetical protein
MNPFRQLLALSPPVLRPVVSLLIGVSLATSSCSPGSDPEDMQNTELSEWIGQTVRIQFRRDALGTAANLPVSPKTGSINGAETTLVGTLLEVNPSSLLINESERPKWVPREVILFVELSP